ncbi:SDR family NAD(P)-dependent oxidoreductase [Frankia sp. AgB32]|uniref:SDR family NAD(P)-dependent oxidoreductase n=1 Tax=Frankia sp. AgB32 TaxID=631119 RepID=UPI0034D73230
MFGVRRGALRRRTRSDRQPWTLADVPDQDGRTAVVTGADSGIGFEIARVLAGSGATVVMACRDLDLAERAADRIRADAGPSGADVRIQRLDLARLASVDAAADAIRAAHPRLDLLVNNAGVMRPTASHTEDGFDATFGVNHLGHFAFTGLLLDRLLPTPGSRIVTVSSLAHLCGRLRADVLSRVPARAEPAAAIIGRPADAARVLGYLPRPRRSADDTPSAPRMRLPYPSSKLANLLFSHELQRRLAAAGAETIAVAAHPGIARTDLVRELPPFARAFVTGRLAPAMGWLIHSSQAGALSPIRATVDPTVRGGDYYGPDGLFGGTGHPAPARAGRVTRDHTRRRLLWTESERITAVTYPLPR